jgi:hypothetical protein
MGDHEAPDAAARGRQNHGHRGVHDRPRGCGGEPPAELELALQDRLVEPAERVHGHRKRQHDEDRDQPRLIEQRRGERGQRRGQQHGGRRGHEHQRQDGALGALVEALAQHQRRTKPEIAEHADQPDGEERQRQQAEVGGNQQPRERDGREDAEDLRTRVGQERPRDAPDCLVLHQRPAITCSK